MDRIIELVKIIVNHDEYTELLYPFERCKESFKQYLLTGNDNGYYDYNNKKFSNTFFHGCKYCYKRLNHKNCLLYTVYYRTKCGNFELLYSIKLNYSKVNDTEKITIYTKMEDNKSELIFKFVNGELQIPDCFDSEKFSIIVSSNGDIREYINYFSHKYAFLSYLKTVYSSQNKVRYTNEYSRNDNVLTHYHLYEDSYCGDTGRTITVNLIKK